MLTHFQYKPLYENREIPGWEFSFFFKRLKHRGFYLQNGQIEWNAFLPGEGEKETLEKQIHELMLYHVYDR